MVYAESCEEQKRCLRLNDVGFGPMSIRSPAPVDSGWNMPDFKGKWGRPQRYGLVKIGKMGPSHGGVPGLMAEVEGHKKFVPINRALGLGWAGAPALR